MAKTSSQLQKQFAFISRAGAKLDDFIQQTALDTLEHYEEHSDSRMVDRLYLALPKGSRHEAMAQFILANFAVVANTDPITKKERPFLNAPDKVNDLEGARKKQWYAYKPSKTPDNITDLQAMVRTILKKVSKEGAVMVGGTAETLRTIAAAVGIPESDVPTVRVAASKAEADKLLAEKLSTDDLGLSS